jgi:hypothetical protein
VDRRSRRLPAAPPRIKPHPREVSLEDDPEKSIQSTAAIATALPRRSTIRLPPRRPKAPPSFFM